MTRALYASIAFLIFASASAAWSGGGGGGERSNGCEYDDDCTKARMPVCDAGACVAASDSDSDDAVSDGCCYGSDVKCDTTDQKMCDRFAAKKGCEWRIGSELDLCASDSDSEDAVSDGCCYGSDVKCDTTDQKMCDRFAAKKGCEWRIGSEPDLCADIPIWTTTTPSPTDIPTVTPTETTVAWTTLPEAGCCFGSDSVCATEVESECTSKTAERRGCEWRSGDDPNLCFNDALCADYKMCEGDGTTSIDGDSVTCSGAESCAGPRITATRGDIDCSGYRSCGPLTGLVASLGHIDCGGYDACEKSILKADSVSCGAYHSCYGTKSITARTVTCGGDWSCYNIESFVVEESLLCDAEWSCRGSDIEVGGLVSFAAQGGGSGSVSASHVECSGIQSCSGQFHGAETVKLYGEGSGEGGEFYGIAEVQGYGHSALKSAIIDSAELSKMTVEVLGVAAGQDATVICRSGALCHVECLADGCAALTYQCEVGATCAVSPDGCKMGSGADEFEGVSCPRFTEPDTNGLSAILIHQRTVREPMDALDVSLSAEWTYEYCYASQQCAGDVIGASTTPYCYGGESCLNAEFVNDGNAYCGGGSSCREAEFNDVGSVICWGADSCRDTAMLTDGRAVAMSCDGRASCAGLRVSNADEDSRLDWFGPWLNVIECQGESGCENADLYSNSDFKCEGSRGCFGAHIEWWADRQQYASLSCHSRESCAEAVMVNPKDVSCIGGYSCQNATMGTAATPGNGDILLQGAQSGESATIYGFSSVTATGYLSMATAVLDSAGGDVSVSVSGHLAGYGAQIVCRAGSECSLRCQGTGCLKLSFVCEAGAECNVFPESCVEGVEFAEATLCPEWATTMKEMAEIGDVENDAVLRYLREKREADRVTQE